LLACINIIGGLIFGYNTGVVAVALPIYTKEVQPLSSGMQGVFTATILIGAMIGSLGGGWYCDKFGRKISVITMGVIGSFCPIAVAVSPNLALMMVSRGILGLSVGLATVACPTYVSENAPESKKGTLGTLFQLAITFGIVVSYLVPLPFNNVHKAYRYMFGIGSIFGTISLLLGIVMPESQTFLSKKSREYDSLLNAKRVSIQQSQGTASLFSGRARKSFLIGELLAVAQQFTGINAFMYYAPAIFQEAGIQNANIPTIGLGAFNFVTTFISTFLVDRLGRRPLLLFGTAVMAVSCILLAVTYQFVEGSTRGVLAIVFLLAFILGFETGEGPLFWVVCAEMFDPEVKGTALSGLNASTWTFNLILTLAFLPLKEAIGQSAVFWLFGAVGTVCVIIMWFVLPETKRRMEGIDPEVRNVAQW